MNDMTEVNINLYEIIGQLTVENEGRKQYVGLLQEEIARLKRELQALRDVDDNDDVYAGILGEVNNGQS